jgi:cytidine deaminase
MFLTDVLQVLAPSGTEAMGRTLSKDPAEVADAGQRLPCCDVRTFASPSVRYAHVSAGAVDWDELRAAATSAMERAYAPYSEYKVGAAALVDDGRTVVGCNVENAAYGVTLCAECGLVSQLHLTGGGLLTHFVCVNGSGDVIMPCGRCRQLLFEHASAEMMLMTVSGIRTMTEVLPDAFGPHDLKDA